MKLSKRGLALFFFLPAVLFCIKYDWSLYAGEGAAVYFLNLYLMALSAFIIYGAVFYLGGKRKAAIIVLIYIYLVSLPSPKVVAKNLGQLKRIVASQEIPAGGERAEGV